MRQVWILHNPLAGSPGRERAVERAGQLMARQGVSVRLERPATIDALCQAARGAIEAQADAVLVAGGDGSLGTAAGVLAGSPVALGVLPTGTANVWARELRLARPSWLRPDGLERAALDLLAGEVRLVDLGCCNGRLFLLWAGLGFDAFVMEQLGPHRRFSRQWGLGYNALATALIARDWRGAPMRVMASGPGPGGGREVEGHYLSVVAANVRGYAGLFQLSPQARLDDGRLEVWLLAGRSYADLWAHTARLFLGRHQGHPAATHLTAESVEIYTPAPLALHQDGEPHEPAAQVSIRVVPQALRVIVPPQAPPDLFINGAVEQKPGAF